MSSGSVGNVSKISCVSVASVSSDTEVSVCDSSCVVLYANVSVGDVKVVSVGLRVESDKNSLGETVYSLKGVTESAVSVECVL